MGEDSLRDQRLTGDRSFTVPAIDASPDGGSSGGELITVRQPIFGRGDYRCYHANIMAAVDCSQRTWPPLE